MLRIGSALPQAGFSPSSTAHITTSWLRRSRRRRSGSGSTPALRIREPTRRGTGITALRREWNGQCRRELAKHAGSDSRLRQAVHTLPRPRQATLAPQSLARVWSVVLAARNGRSSPTTSRHIVFNLSRPDKSLILLAPLATAAGGWGLCKDPKTKQTASVFAGTTDADYQKLLAMCTAGKQSSNR